MSSQFYDDWFRFFFELLQNADDARYSNVEGGPAIHFTITPTHLVVDLNEDGFTLADVLSICDTGESSKRLSDEVTGEKGFGFKAVFGIADQVHIQSGLWSFCFEHQRHEDGLGMISPLFESGQILPPNVRTRFRLRYSKSEEVTLKELCTRLEAQHPSIVFALRRLRTISMQFNNVEGRNYSISFNKLSSTSNDMTRIVSKVAGKTTEFVYRTFTRTVKNLPQRLNRTRPSSTIQIGLPVSAHDSDMPIINADGEFVFAFLPVVQMPQLHFLIQADFVLPGSRQAVSDNPWNRRLRDEVACLFALSMKTIARENKPLS